jgi:hypothetical protein
VIVLQAIHPAPFPGNGGWIYETSAVGHRHPIDAIRIPVGFAVRSTTASECIGADIRNGIAVFVFVDRTRTAVVSVLSMR